MNEYAYNSGGNLISDTYREWNAITSQWKNVMLEEYTCDININKVLSAENAWDGNQWVESWQSEMNYNNDYTADELNMPCYLKVEV